MSRESKLDARLFTAIFLTVVGSALLIAGFFAPPTGIIDSSVLVAFGETSTFVAAVLGIDYNYKYQMFKTENMNNVK